MYVCIYVNVYEYVCVCMYVCVCIYTYKISFNLDLIQLHSPPRSVASFRQCLPLLPFPSQFNIYCLLL